MRFALVAFMPVLFGSFAAAGTDSDAWPDGVSYGSKGLQYESADGNNFLWFGVRLQTRLTESRIDFVDASGKPDDDSSELKLNRGRFKLGGHLGSPRFDVYTEYDFTKGHLLDLRATYEISDRLFLRVGQWKADYNRERIDSSGAQQFVDRSIVTPWFTVDRQVGAVISGRLAPGKALDSSFWFGWLSGAGRGNNPNQAEGLLIGRYQWNFTRRVLAFSQGDLERREKPAGSIAVAAVSGETMYTRFSSDGGGQLPGYEGGDSDRYQLRQGMFETAWQYRGFSWQQEFHWKQIDDTESKSRQTLIGGYLQAGMFFSEVWDVVPKPLELALRYASVDPEEKTDNGFERENTIGANWFIKGHRNKLSADISRIERKQNNARQTEKRFRLQWDVSF